MDNKLRVAMAQIDVLVGDVSGNTSKVIETACDARDRLKANVVVFPELTLTGYPPEDLLLRPAMAGQIDSALSAIKTAVSGISIVLGYPDYCENGCHNAAAVITGGEIQYRYYKQALPNHSVFDEKRYFRAGTTSTIAEISGVKVALSICEDIWQADALAQAKEAGAQLVINLNASPFHAGKQTEREAVLAQRVAESGLPIVYLNLVGGQDELIFDGGSFVINAQGQVTQRLPSLVETVMVAEFEQQENGALVALPAWVTPLPVNDAMVYNALVLAVRDYIQKNGFNSVVIGLSGGIDSALTLAIAVDAIGADNVEAVTMPSRYTADMSVEDSFAECKALGIKCHQIEIEPMYQSFLTALKDDFLGEQPDATEENIQARCRGVILMAISNKGRKIVLTTGNKSEMSVGYATLYGDMAGGFAPLKDVPKLLVYRLSNYRNTVSRVIPQRVIDRPPSAELAPDQKDEDSLPPYEILDPVLEMYVEQDMSPEAIIKAGYDSEMVRQVVAMVKRNEYKRRQAPPGVKITARAFGRDRRYPITSGFHEA